MGKTPNDTLLKEGDEEGVDDFGVFEVGDVAGIFDYMEFGLRNLGDEVFNIGIRNGLVMAAPDELDGDAGI